MNTPKIPRRSVLATNGYVSRDWDASYFQPMLQAVTTLTPGGTFANNAAAIAGGLAVGRVYQTAAGELRIVV